MSIFATKDIALKEKSLESYYIPEHYRYYDILNEHLKTDVVNIAFNKGTPAIFPRQLEIHLGRDSGKPCNLSCDHCQGSEVDKTMVDNSETILSLIRNIDGKIPNFIFGGVYTESLLSPNFSKIIDTIKETDAAFGLHTNGTLLWPLEKKTGLLSRMIEVSDERDYVSISMDSGSPRSFSLTKNAPPILFENILRAIEHYKKVDERSAKKNFKLRLTYLLNEYNSEKKELENMIKYVKDIGPAVSSLRFSIPYAIYGKNMEECKNYKENHEEPFFAKIKEIIEPLLNFGEAPQILLMPPENQDVGKLDFHHCYYGYYQLTLGADGYFYRCSSSATPSFKHMRLGPATEDMADFLRIIKWNQTENFNPQKECFDNCVRCSRMALMINNVADEKKYAANKNN